MQAITEADRQRGLEHFYGWNSSGGGGGGKGRKGRSRRGREGCGKQEGMSSSGACVGERRACIPVHLKAFSKG